MPREYTCGVFLLNANDEILIAHPTGANKESWSIPKGKAEDEEAYIEAAERELWEETGVNAELLRERLVMPIMSFASINYRRRRKTLVPFLYKIKDTMHNFPFYCSLIRGNKGPECDEFRWVSIEEAKRLIHYTQAQALCEIENFLKLKEYVGKTSK